MKTVSFRITDWYCTHEQNQQQQCDQRSQRTTVLDLPSDYGKCSNVAPTESNQHKNRWNWLHGTCSELAWTPSFLSIAWPRSVAGSSHGASIRAGQKFHIAKPERRSALFMCFSKLCQSIQQSQFPMSSVGWSSRRLWGSYDTVR